MSGIDNGAYNHLTDDTIEKLNKLTDTFFKKVGRKERLRRQILRSMDESEAYLYPKIGEWLQGAREQIIKDIRKKILRKGSEQEDHSTKIKKKKSKSQIVVDFVDWETIENNGKSIVKPAYLNVMEKSGNLARQQGRIEASFDVINPRSVESAEKYSYDLVTNVGKETKAGLRAIVTHGMKKGKTLVQIAKEIKATGIGLNERQAKTLLKYGDALEAQGITGKLYQEKWKKYFNRLQRDRSKMIARTEVSRSANEGYLESLEGTRYEEVELSSAADACTDCLALAGQKFKRSEAKGMLPIHPNCRCHWIVVIPRKKKPRIPIIPRVPKKPVPKEPKVPRKRTASTLDYDIVNKKRESLAFKESEEVFNAYAKDNGLKNAKEYNKKATEYLKKTIDKATVNIRVDGRALDDIIRDMRFKTQFEVKRSSGAYAPKSRAELEKILFKTKTNIDDKLRPIYGFLEDSTNLNAEATRMYGNVKVVINKKYMINRITFVGDDSLTILHEDYICPQLLKNPSAITFAEDVVRLKGNLGELQSFWNYTEVQIHGGLNFNKNTIRKIITKIGDLTQSTLDKLSNLGIKVEFVR